MIYHTSLASHELARRGDFALVVVPMMRNGFTHSFSAYEHFFSGFSCLAVPFGEYLRREYICSVLGFDGQPKALILDPSQRVLYHGQPKMFSRFGGAEGGAFPFTPDRVGAYLRHERGWHDHYSLNELLGLRDTDVLYNIGYYHAGSDRLEDEEDGRRGITISELKRKFVGIYVCFDGSSLYELEAVYKECCKRGKECELEIVVVGVPFVGMEPPKLMEKFMIEALESVKLLGWWFLPFNNTVSHRLCRMRSDSQEDGLFIVDPVRKYVDVYGFPVMADFGGVDAYPFNRRNLIEKEFERKMGLRLKSLLPSCWEQHVIKRLNNMDEEVPLAQVLEKMPFVVLYMYKGGKVFEKKNKIWWGYEDGDKLAAWYKNEIRGKGHSSSVVVVTVSMDGIDGDTDWFLETEWSVCPADPFKSAKICDEYFFHRQCRPDEVVVAFGEDGRIQSLDASHIMECQGPPFHANNLHAEIAKEFYKTGFLYMYHAAAL
ncbi:unnamed protein product [Cuscuta campestris]|uniref:Thioredoxin-like fold domain-containing protein n=1 Tax=Cuscuta campestris TaxID=132261 RepID=A0A484LRH9_9ASTE|nr:unnamed protein product [Cuscuta campestris]